MFGDLQVPCESPGRFRQSAGAPVYEAHVIQQESAEILPLQHLYQGAGPTSPGQRPVEMAALEMDEDEADGRARSLLQQHRICGARPIAAPGRRRCPAIGLLQQLDPLRELAQPRPHVPQMTQDPGLEQPRDRGVAAPRQLCGTLEFTPGLLQPTAVVQGTGVPQESPDHLLGASTSLAIGQQIEGDLVQRRRPGRLAACGGGGGGRKGGPERVPPQRWIAAAGGVLREPGFDLLACPQRRWLLREQRMECVSLLDGKAVIDDALGQRMGQTDRIQRRTVWIGRHPVAPGELGESAPELTGSGPSDAGHPRRRRLDAEDREGRRQTPSFPAEPRETVRNQGRQKRRDHRLRKSAAQLPGASFHRGRACDRPRFPQQAQDLDGEKRVPSAHTDEPAPDLAPKRGVEQEAGHFLDRRRSERAQVDTQEGALRLQLCRKGCLGCADLVGAEGGHDQERRPSRAHEQVAEHGTDLVRSLVQVINQKGDGSLLGQPGQDTNQSVQAPRGARQPSRLPGRTMAGSRGLGWGRRREQIRKGVSEVGRKFDPEALGMAGDEEKRPDQIIQERVIRGPPKGACLQGEKSPSVEPVSDFSKAAALARACLRAQPHEARFAVQNLIDRGLDPGQFVLPPTQRSRCRILHRHHKPRSRFADLGIAAQR